MEAEGGFVMCEVEDQQAVRIEGDPQKRRAVIRVESEETKVTPWSSVVVGILAKKMLRRSALCQVRKVSLCGLCTCATTNAVKGFKHFQLAAIVSEEGGAVRTVNLCEPWHNERRAVERNDGTESISWQAVEGMWNVYARDVGAFYRQKSMGQGSPGSCRDREAGRHTR